MGGIATTATNTLGTLNLINSDRRQRRDLSRQKANDLESRKNLLNEQLAAKRASLGAMGLHSSSMESGFTSKLTKDYYTDTVNSLYDYKNKKSDLAYKRNVGLTNYTNKIIK